MEKEHPRFRDAAQLLSELRPILGDDCYVRRINEYSLTTSEVVVVDDLRYPNEEAYLRAIAGEVVVVRIHRPGLQSDLTQLQQNHASEQAMWDIDTDWVEENPEESPQLAAARILVKTLKRWRILDRLRIYYGGPLSAGNWAENVSRAKQHCGFFMTRGLHYFLPHTQDCKLPVPKYGEEDYEWSLQNSMNLLGYGTNIMVYEDCPESHGLQREKAFCDENEIPRIEFQEFVELLNGK